jgi:hypothetical protein
MHHAWTRGLVYSILATYAATPLIADGPDHLKSVLIENVPHVTQKPDFCGEACAEMFLKKLGHQISQDDIYNLSKLNPAEGRGCYTPELARALQAAGFDIGQVNYGVKASRAAKALTGLFEDMHADLAKGIPSIICMNTSSGRDSTEHFRLILGYDQKTDEVVYHEPAENNGLYHRLDRKTFLNLWPLRYDKQKWTVIRMPLHAGRIQAPPSYPGFSPADYAQHVHSLKQMLKGRDFTIIVQPPFVVIGDEPADIVEQRSKMTVKWSVDKLKERYFKQDPDQLLNIWLFKDKVSYEKHAREIFNSRPDTPFGYYSRSDKALVMNIATGGGTLVHEIVHPFVEANFPNCPSWFNEGLGSLYEQSHTRNNKIVGLTNWRLAGLQKAIKAERVPSFETLTSTTTHEFYNEDRGTNYAQARYLCYFLQEKELLENFYHQFVKNQAEDPTGYETLKEVLNTTDMDSFQKKWEAWVLTLTFP